MARIGSEISQSESGAVYEQFIGWDLLFICDRQSEKGNQKQSLENILVSSNTILYTPCTLQDKHYVIDNILVTEQRYLRTMTWYYLASWKSSNPMNKLSPMIMLLNVVFGIYWSLKKIIVALELDSKLTELIPLSYVKFIELEEIYSSQLNLPSCVLLMLPLTLLFCASGKFKTKNTKPYINNIMKSIASILSYTDKRFNSDLLDESSLIETSSNYQLAIHTRKELFSFVKKGMTLNGRGSGVIRQISQMVYTHWKYAYMAHIEGIVEEICIRRPWILGFEQIANERKRLMLFREVLSTKSQDVMHAKFIFNEKITNFVSETKMPILSALGFKLASLKVPNFQDNLRTVPKSAHVELIINELYELIQKIESELAVTEYATIYSEGLSSAGKLILQKAIKKWCGGYPLGRKK